MRINAVASPTRRPLGAQMVEMQHVDGGSLKAIPNILSGLRILAVPFLLFLAWKGHSTLFVCILIMALLTDSIDGYIARKYNLSSNLGTKLDSVGDMCIYLTVPLCAWWLWPHILKQEAFFVGVAVCAYVVPLIAGVLKFRRIPSYHTLAAKASAVVMSVAAVLLFTFGFEGMFRVAAVLQFLVAVEEVLITIRLPAPQSNVKSLWHVKKSALKKN